MAKAVIAALRDAGFRSGMVIARNPDSGQVLAQSYGFPWRPELGADRPQLLINVTPIGMSGGAEADDMSFERDAVEAADTVFDVVALPPDTPLIRYARERRVNTITGAEVIALQAAEQFALYTGVRLSDDQIRRAAAFARSER